MAAKDSPKVPARVTTYVVLTKLPSETAWSLMFATKTGDPEPMQFTGTREKVIGEAFAELRATEDEREHGIEREISPVALRGWKPAIVHVESVEKVVVGR